MEIVAAIQITVAKRSSAPSVGLPAPQLSHGITALCRNSVPRFGTTKFVVARQRSPAAQVTLSAMFAFESAMNLDSLVLLGEASRSLGCDGPCFWGRHLAKLQVRKADYR